MSRSSCGPRFPIRTIRSIAPRHGARCTIPTPWCCPPTGLWIWSAGPGGTAPHWKARRRLPIPSWPSFARTDSGFPPQTDRQLAEMMANYYGMISHVDHQVGRILDGLRQSGLADNTLIVFASDHGDMLGDHGLYLKGPMLYEGLLRVPMIISGPGIAHGQRIETPVSTST